MADFLNEMADHTARVFGEIDQETTAFGARSGIHCRPGCGQCCLKPGIEASASELLPLARHLLATGQADAAYDRAAAAGGGICVFYEAQAQDPSLGRCSVYAFRPSTCRLFGFAAAPTKLGPTLTACAWHKRLQPEAVAEAQAAITAGEHVPMFTDYDVQLRVLAGHTALGEMKALNLAFMTAVEKMSLAGAGPDAAARVEAAPSLP